MATRRRALVDGEGDDEGSASGAEPGADDCALQREGGCPYGPGDCPGIEVVESEAGWRRRPCVRRRPPHGLSGCGFEDDRARPRGGVAFP